MDQSEIMHKYNADCREKFNPDLFNRNEDDIIKELKNVILSCQRNGFFTIQVESFDVVEDYDTIYQMLYENEENTRNKSKKKENIYSFINLKDSDIKLLVVHYYIKIKEEEDRVDVLIAVPRIVDKYYFRINGNVFSAMYQIVEETYNNSTSNSKKPSVTKKTMFMPIRIYHTTYTLKTTKKESIKTTFYSSRIFNKSLGGMKYILGKFGLYGTFQFLGINCIYISQYDPMDDNYYTFNKHDAVYVSVPKFLFDNNLMVQSLVCTIYRSIIKDVEFEELFTDRYWLSSLGGEFNNFTEEKGISILESLESIYDLSTKEHISLPEEYKADVYCILKWLMREFNYLKNKDNLDIGMKRIRYAEYIASLYAMKLSKGIYRVADLNKKANIDSIKKAICTVPTYLISAIGKCKLVNYRNMVNDMDSMTALKFTYKGISGLGEQNSNSIPDIYRAIDVSHIGRVDLDSSSATDPGITGTLCPLVQLNNYSFSEYQEPNFWEQEFNQLMDEYRTANNLKEAAIFKDKVLGIDTTEEVEVLHESLSIMKQLIKPIYYVESTTEDVGEFCNQGGEYDGG